MYLLLMQNELMVKSVNMWVPQIKTINIFQYSSNILNDYFVKSEYPYNWKMINKDY